ncbi:MAG: O-antigen ligase family protein, partial [Verrucomicrobiales bacterium]
DEPIPMAEDDVLRRSGLALSLMGLLLITAIFLVNAPWAGYRGIFLLAMGLLMAIFPPPARLPWIWWVLAGLGILAGLASYLPAAWFPQPAWRTEFQSLGIPTENLVTIQWQQALEAHAILLMIPLGALWMAGHRVKGGSVRHLALAFVCAIAAYAFVSKFMQGESVHGSGNGAERFGILPNRNHSALLLAMGVVAGLGCIVQAIRERRWFSFGVALVATLVCAWAAAAWSISRAGILLAAVGALILLPLMGWSYLGRNGRWAVVLLIVAFGGAFALTETTVKDRINKTIATPASSESGEQAEPERHLREILLAKDFRVPIALDTFDLIRDHPWTGVGADQFRYIFPQYRVRSSTNNNSLCLHPESDWLWIATEFGIPAAVFLLLAVVFALPTAARGVMRGRDRAVRAACLAAAALLPIHGFIDVPGHRIALALAAAWLFSLALHSRPEAEDGSVDAPGRAPASRRLWALPVLLVAGWMLWLQGGGGLGDRTTLFDRTRKEIERIYAQDWEARNAATARGETYEPSEAEDPLLPGLGLLEQAVAAMPLNRGLRCLQGALAYFFDEKTELARHAFAVERALDPRWVAGPLWQANACDWCLPDDAVALWDIAMQRAEWLESKDPGNHWGKSATWAHIRHAASKGQELKKRWEDWEKRHPKPDSTRN